MQILYSSMDRLDYRHTNDGNVRWKKYPVGAFRVER